MKKFNPEELKISLDKMFTELGEEGVAKKNKEALEQMEEQYQRFEKHFNSGTCYLCLLPLDSVKEEMPCVHWLLRKNNRFKKKQHFPSVFQKFDMFQIQAYLRWCATLENPFGNINDFEDEVSNPDNFEAAIIFENIEWTFSCSGNDLSGHPGTMSDFPHYHFQMKINSLPFIKFYDFHIPLSEHDLFNITLFKHHGQTAKQTFGRGDSVKKIFEYLKPEEILDHASKSTDEANSIYHFGTTIEADPGTMISGDLIADLMEESNKTGVPMAKLLQRVPNAKVQTIISASDSLPEFGERTGRGSKKTK